MKIIYCIAGTYNSGGMERVLANKANYLVRKGYDISVVTTEQRGKSSFFAMDNRIAHYDLGINYELNNGKSFLNKILHYPPKQWKHRRRLSNLLSRLKADIVISMFDNEASFLWKIEDGSRKMLEIHFSRYKRLQQGRKGVWAVADRFRNWLDAKTVGRYEKFIVLTHEDAGYWGHLPNIAVIPNALSFVTQQCADLTNKKAIAIGRYNYQKGFNYLIKAWEMVHSQQPDWTLDIIGEGELKKQLQVQIDRLKLNDSVHLKSPTRHIEEEYTQSSIVVMSSHYEGLPMVLLEAQATGLATVSFACKCGPRDIITDGKNGFLVPEGDVNALAEKILILMEDEELRKKMGQAAKENSKRFSEEVIMQQWEELFAEVTKQEGKNQIGKDNNPISTN
jgi:glycosyltransferase involved in cell wall biosynthesis